MRIKNEVSTANNQSLLCFFAFFMTFFIIDISIIGIALNSGMSFIEVFQWIKDEFLIADKELKFVYLVLIILPFVWLFLLIEELKRRINDEKLARTLNSIRYADFFENKFIIKYSNDLDFEEYSYSQINKMELIIDTCIIHNKNGAYSALKALNINIEVDGKLLSILHLPVDLNKLFKLIYYSQYIENFSYRFTGSGQKTKKRLGKLIKSYIENNYKKTFQIYLYSSINPFVLAFVIGILLVAWILFLAGLFN